MKSLSLLLFLILTGSGAQNGMVDWRKIVPMTSRRADVEAMLGAPSFGTNFVLGYDTKDVRVTVWYGGAKPSKQDSCKWSIDSDVVFSFVYAPKKKVLLADLLLDLASFEKQKAVEIPQDFYYYNPKEGLTITTRIEADQEVLLNIERNPPQAQREKYCIKTGNLEN